MMRPAPPAPCRECGAAGVHQPNCPLAQTWRARVTLTVEATVDVRGASRPEVEATLARLLDTSTNEGRAMVHRLVDRSHAHLDSAQVVDLTHLL